MEKFMDSIIIFIYFAAHKNDFSGEYVGISIL